MSGVGRSSLLAQTVVSNSECIIADTCYLSQRVMMSTLEIRQVCENARCRDRFHGSASFGGRDARTSELECVV